VGKRAKKNSLGMFAGSGHEAEVMGGSIKRPVHIVQLSCLVVASIFFGPRHCSSTSATNWTQPTTLHRARNKSHTCDQLEKGFQVAGKSRARTRAAGGRQSACSMCAGEVWSKTKVSHRTRASRSQTRGLYSSPLKSSHHRGLK
jgi:hypothetical protein